MMTLYPHKAWMMPAALGLATIGLGACTAEDSEAEAGEATVAPSIAEVLENADNLSRFNTALATAGIESVFEGPGSYTILAPTDDAFAKLSAEGDALTAEGNGAVLAALLRNHILPGHISAETMNASLASSDTGMEIRNLGNSVLKITREGNQVLVSNDNGARAQIDGSELETERGVVIPIDTVLVSAAPQ